MIDRRRATIMALYARIDRLEYENQRLRTNSAFGCLTRQGLELALEEADLTGHVCVYWDLDYMKQANEEDPEGKPGVNKRIRAALQVRSTDYVAGQVFSGDEFCAWPLAEEAVEMAERLLTSFRTQGLPGTFVIVHLQPNEAPLDLLVRAEDICAQQKRLGKRNTIFFVAP